MRLSGETPRFADIENVPGFIQDCDITGATLNDGLEKFLTAINLIKEPRQRRR
jgi:hypothetical protein